MRPLLALLLASLLVPLALPTVAATVRTCNSASSPVWVDADCYSGWASHQCFTYWEMLWCSSCAYSVEGAVNSVVFLLTFCLPVRVA